MFIGGVVEKYPEELLKDRVKIEGNVISCIYKDPLLLDEAKLDTTNFLTQDGAYYFALAKNLRQKGFYSFDEVTVLSNISEELEIGFVGRGGWEVIQNLIDIINIQNWDTYLDILYRENIILGLYEDGFNVLKEIDINNKKIKPLELFRKMDSESVLDWYEARLTSYGTGYSSKVLEEEEIDFDDEFIKGCEEGLEAGVPFDTAGIDINGNEINCLPFLSRQIDGLADGTFNIIGGYSSTGKSTLWVTVLMALLHRGRKVLIISNEQKIKVFKIQFMVWLLGKYLRYFKLSKKKMKNGDLTEEDKLYLAKIQKYWRDNYKGRVKMIAIADANMSLVKKKIRENVLRYGYDTVLYDTFKLDFEDDKKEYLSLIKDTRDFDAMSKKYNIIMCASLQLAINTIGKLFLDASVLSMSKQIKESLETLLLMRVVYQEELDKDNKRYYCSPFQLKKVNDKWIEQEYIPDQSAVYRMLFPDKTRNGSNSGDTGVAYLLKFDGEHGIFREVAMARPKHGRID